MDQTLEKVQALLAVPHLKTNPDIKQAIKLEEEGDQIIADSPYKRITKACKYHDAQRIILIIHGVRDKKLSDKIDKLKII
jgi:hypothetical protein